MTTAARIDTRHLARDAWGWYAVLAVCLAPVLVPPGPGRSALLDPLNLVAMLAFAAVVALSRRNILVPFAGPVILMSLGSLLATANAVNAPAAMFTLLQDAYLYLWFVVLVNVLRDRGELRGLRVAWVLAASVVSVIGLIGIVQHGADSVAAVLNPKGFRAMGTFDQPDELADYLAMSVFMALSLEGRAGRLLRWFSIALMLAAIAATKSNGGMLALVVGLVAWAVVRAWTLGVTPAGWIAAGLVSLSAVPLAVWLVAGLGVGAAQLGQLEANSFLGRMSHSSEGRTRIWNTLGKRYERSPLGIGPGNSRWQSVTLEERERPVAGHYNTYDSGADPFLSKEAHNDYLAYLIERGPIALFGMLLLRWQAFLRILGSGRSGRGRSRAGAVSGAVTAALFGAWVASCLNANTIETLHFRHVWVFLAMVCVIGAGGSREPEPERARRVPLPSMTPAGLPS